MYLKDGMLGKKIKTLRLEKKMTQAELSGETITRNMLSQIENGVAQPSVSTIMELAEKLDTPIEYFFSEHGELSDFKKIGAINKIRKLYGTGEYTKCINRLDALDVSDDETEYLYAKSFLAKGVEAYRKGELRSATCFLESAMAHGSHSVYIDKELFSVANAYLHVISYIGAGDTPLVVSESVSERCEAQMDDILYMYALAGHTGILPFAPKNALYAEHLRLREDFDFTDEIKMKTSVEALKELLLRCEEERFAILKYYIYCDLEKLASSCGDYKCAYECSSKRLLLAEKMNH